MTNNKITRVKFYDPSFSPDSKLVYSVIAARYKGKWIFVRHRKRKTWEIAGGHIEKGESSDDTARRELKEETGAEEFTIDRIATYSVEKEGSTRYGRLYIAEVSVLGDIPDFSEIKEIILMDNLPVRLTHPDIQPYLFARTVEYLRERGRL